MQRQYTLFFFLASAACFIHAQDMVQTDSVDTSKKYYPILTLPEGDMGSVVQTYRFEEAQTNINTWITQLKRRRKDTSKLESQLELCDRCINGLKGTDKIVVFDSIVVDKDNFLSGYKYMNDLGTITLSPDGKKTTYTTEMGNKMYEPINILTDEGNPSSTFKCSLIENGVKISSTIVDGIDIEGELNYPYLMSDGVTFYFSAISDQGFGNYDLYITRYDSEEDRFYRADNLGYPYNSYANDYMMVIDEENKVGWFASDRFQPEGKVCIYSFIYEPSRHPYNFESEDHQMIASAASLRSISSTWTTDNEYDRIQAKQRLALSASTSNKKKKVDFRFVINENFVYEKISDFHNEEARTKFVEWQKMTKELHSNQEILDKMRQQYAFSNNAGKSKLTTPIQVLEEKVECQIKEVHIMEKEIRALENK